MMRWPKLALLCVCLCQCSNYDEPATPDLSGLEALYDHPPGKIERIDLEQVMNKAAETYALIQQYGNFDFMVQTLEHAIDNMNEAANPDDNGRFKLSATGRVQAPCGRDEGTLELRLVVRRNYLQPGIAGTFAQCMTQGGGYFRTLDGLLDIFLRQAMPLNQVDLSQVLVQFEGVADVMGGRRFDGRLHFRILDQENIEVGMLDESDMVIVGFLSDGGVRLRTDDGSFCCDLEQRMCLSLSGDSCEQAQPGDEVWIW